MRMIFCSLLVMTMLGCSGSGDDGNPQANNPQVRPPGGGLIGGALIPGADDKPIGSRDQQTPQTNNPQGRPAGGGLIGGALIPGADDKPIGSRDQNRPPVNKPKPLPLAPTFKAKIVEWPQYGQQHPGVVVVDQKVQGGDPLSIAASAYKNLPDRIMMLNFQNEYKTWELLNGRDPKPADLEAMLKRHKLELDKQPKNRFYGFDPKSGALVLLEDKSQK